jgi:signal transduction histidine kinase
MKLQWSAHMKTAMKMMVLAGTLACSSMACAADRGTANEAVALVHKVITAMKTGGREKTIDQVNAGQFNDRDMYVTVFTLDGVNIANGNNAKMVNKNLLDLQDVEGRPFVKLAIESAKKNGKAWTDFKGPSPVTKNLEQKSTYSERYEDLIVNCGVFKPR